MDRKYWTLPPTACRGKWVFQVGSENCTLIVKKHWIWKLHNISIYICISQCKTLRKWVVTFDVFRLLKHFPKLNSIVAMGLCEHDVMLSKHGRLSTGIKMPGVVLQLSLVDLKTSTKQSRRSEKKKREGFHSVAMVHSLKLKAFRWKMNFCLCLRLVSVCPSLCLSPCSERMTNRESQRQQTGMS